MKRKFESPSERRARLKRILRPWWNSRQKRRERLREIRERAAEQKRYDADVDENSKTVGATMGDFVDELSSTAVCDKRCGPGWTPGYCDPDCPNAPEPVDYAELEQRVAIQMTQHVPRFYRGFYHVGAQVDSWPSYAEGPVKWEHNCAFVCQDGEMRRLPVR